MNRRPANGCATRRILNCTAKIPVTTLMSKQNSLSAADLALPFACILIVSTLFTAGLWPFNPFPRNEVTWLGHWKGAPVWGARGGFQQGALPTPRPESGVLLYARNSIAAGPSPERLRHAAGVLYA